MDAQEFQTNNSAKKSGSCKLVLIVNCYSKMVECANNGTSTKLSAAEKLNLISILTQTNS